jgi:hypothetical protein
MPAKHFPAGTVDFNHGSSVLAAGGAAASDKPESKLFFTPDNRWGRCWATHPALEAQASTSTSS